MKENKEYFLIQNIIFNQKDYAKAFELLNLSEFFSQTAYQELYAQTLFRQGNFSSAALIYEKIGKFYEVGYCHLLLNEREKAYEFWKLSQDSPARNWGMFFCEVFTENLTKYPSYLQIRAFLERDLSLFLKLNLIEFVQKIIDISEYLFDINPETNKIIARSFLYNNYPNYAKEYFYRAFDYTNQDAELYYLWGLYNLQIKNTSDCINALRKAISINENYIPAKELLNKLLITQ